MVLVQELLFEDAGEVVAVQHRNDRLRSNLLVTCSNFRAFK